SVTVTLALFSLCQLQTPNQASAFWIGFDPFAFFQGPFLHFHTHGSITDRAFNNQIFAPSCIPKVIEAVKQVDKEETKFFPHTPIPVHAPILGIIQEAYVPAHHFDRNNGMGGGDPYVGSKEAVKLGVLYLKDRRKEIVDQAKSGNTDAAIAALGQALHALQDFFAHSNFVNLNSNPTSNPLSPEQQKLIDYLLSE